MAYDLDDPDAPIPPRRAPQWGLALQADLLLVAIGAALVWLFVRG